MSLNDEAREDAVCQQFMRETKRIARVHMIYGVICKNVERVSVIKKLSMMGE